MNQYKKQKTFNPVSFNFKHDDKAVSEAIKKIFTEINATRSMINEELTNIERTASGSQTDVVQNVIVGGGTGGASIITPPTPAIDKFKRINQNVVQGINEITIADFGTSDYEITGFVQNETTKEVSMALFLYTTRTPTSFQVESDIEGNLRCVIIKS